MNNSVPLEKIKDNLSYACPSILEKTSLDDSQFELLFMETLRKEVPLETFLSKTIEDLNFNNKEIIPFICKNINDKTHSGTRKLAINSSIHALIIGSKEPDMSNNEILCSVFACIAKNLPEIQQEECSYFIPEELRPEFRKTLKILNTLDSNTLSTLKNEYESSQKGFNLPTSEIKIKTVAIDAYNAIVHSTGINLLERLKEDGLDMSKINFEDYSPISEGATQTGYKRRNNKIKEELEEFEIMREKIKESIPSPQYSPQYLK